MTSTFTGILLLCAFLAGSIPFGLLIARLFQVKNLRTHGSGNIGATNVSRVVGFWPAGFLTFFMDVLKGAALVLVVAHTGFPSLLASVVSPSLDPVPLVTPLLLWSIGLLAVLGHCYSPWLQFRGGKGVATGFGAMLALSPISALAGIAGFLYVFVTTRTGSLSSLSGVAIASLAYVVINPAGAQMIPGAAMIFVILLRHEENLDALLANQEKKFE